MRCPSCGCLDSKVVDSRSSEEGDAIRRRRECLECGRRFTTYERQGENPFIIIKSDGSSEAYDREKIFRGLLIACAKRPITSEQINAIVDSLEQDLRTMPKNEIKSKALGEMVLRKLSDVDQVAYVRFASVYKDFKNVDEFTKVLGDLR